MKKIIAIFTLITLLLTNAPLSALPVMASEKSNHHNPYSVGYARVDINPYVIEDDPSSGIMALPLRGFGDVWNRLSKDTLLDDNGDGKVNEEDGLKATCIAVSDDEGKTVLMITVDLIAGTMVNQVRPAVIQRINSAIASGDIKNVQELTEADVYYAGTHTHSGPDTGAYIAKGKTGTNNDGVDLRVANENLGIWIERTVEDICDAAVLALEDRAEANLEKDQLSLSHATSPVLKDRSMVVTRHYNTEVDGDPFVSGDNFNDIQRDWYADPSDYQTGRGINPKQITQADDHIYLLKFAFESSEKLPIILTSWRGHPSLNSSDSYQNSGRAYISADYISAYRHALEYGCDVSFNDVNGYITSWSLGTTQKYRVAFFSATGGNINTRNFERITYHGTNGDVEQRGFSWINDAAQNAMIKGRGCSYGAVLSVLAQECINDGLNETEVQNGKIQTSQLIYYAEKKTTGIHELSYKAAVAHNAAVTQGTITYPFRYTDPDTGETFLIGSRFQPGAIINAWNPVLGIPKTDSVKVELGAILFGQDVAFVSAPGEPYDYYYKDTTLTGDALTAPENNLWNELIAEDTYGKPFVLGYSNGDVGYFVNHKGYTYNQGSSKYVVGCYESQITTLEQGTGEAMVRIFGEMLTGMSENDSLDYTAFCEHCGENQLWKPYNGQTELTTGHYYLSADTQIAQIKIAGGQTVCFDLKGYTLTGTTRAFYTADTVHDVLSIMDSSAAQSGTVQGSGAINGAAIGYGGGTIIVSEGDELNLYSGTLTYRHRKAYSAISGGVLRVKGTFNMYGGKVTGGVASSFSGNYYSGGVKTANRTGYGGNISVAGTINLYGGQITDSQITTITGTVAQKEGGSYAYTEEIQVTGGQGNSVYVESGGTVNLFDSACVEQLHFAQGSALNVIGVYTGSAELKFDSVVSLTEGIVVGSAMDYADTSQALITFADAPGMTAAVKGSDLVVSDVPYTFGTCEACGDCRWIPVTDAMMDSWNKLDMLPGHYVLTENIATVQKQLKVDGNHPATYCIDLNGYTLTGATRAFLVSGGATLNIFDRTGNGVIEGLSGANIGGGVLYADKNAQINLYSGRIRHNTANSEYTKNGAVLKVNSGTFRMYGGIIEAGNVSENGGAINVTMESGPVGTFVAMGGAVTMGSAMGSGNCVFIGKGCNVLLGGDAQIAELYFEAETADSLTLENGYNGSVTLRFTKDPTDLQDIGNCTGRDLFKANITIANAIDKTVAVRDADLLISDISCVYGSCEACGECAWLPLSNAQLDAWGKYNMPPGHYFLIEDVTTVQKQINYNGDLPGVFCLDLSGHIFTGATRSFVVYSDAHLNIFDSVDGGVMQGQMAAGSGGVLSVNKGSVDMYGGTLQTLNTKSEQILNAGSVRVNGGSFHLRGGTVIGFPVSTYGGAIYVTAVSDVDSSLIISGGHILSGAADTAGDCVYLSKGSAVLLSGDAEIDSITFADSSAQSLSVEAGFSGCVELEYPDTLPMQIGSVLGSVISSGELKQASLRVRGFTCAVAAVKGNQLVLTEDTALHVYQTETVLPDCTNGGFTTYTCTLCGQVYIADEVPAYGHSYETEVTAPTCTASGFTTYTCHCGYSFVADHLKANGHTYVGGVCEICQACEACGACEWMSIGQTEVDAWDKFGMPPGHYILSEDVTTVQKQINADGTKPGSYCINLNGHTFTSATRAFYVHADAYLNILDSVGSGVMQGQMGTGSGGVIYVSKGHVAVYGGTLQHLNSKSEQISNGGTVRVNGGSFHLHGGTICGFPVSAYGGAIYVTTVADNTSSLVISGGQVLLGTAGSAGDGVYISQGALVTLSNAAKIARITFAGSSADALTLTGSFRGVVELEYPVSLVPGEGDVIGIAESMAEGTISLKDLPCLVPVIQEEMLVLSVDDERHIYQPVMTPPTCTEGGFTTYTCACGKQYVDDEIPPVQHNYETVTVDATCNTDGSITITCSTCGDSKFAIIPATGHSYESGICTACGEKDPAYVTTPTLTLKAPTLEFKDMICVVAFYTAENIEDVVEMGMITYKIQVSQWDVETADHVIPGAEYDAVSGRYFSSSQGIHAKYLVDDVYLACYAKLTDGSYVYTKLAPYSPITYAKNQLKNASNVQLKQLVAAMLNYGAAAQTYFGYHTQLLANACMTEEQQALPEIYRSDMVQAVPTASTEKQGVFANNKGFSVRKPAISFEGAFCINYFFTPAYAPVDGIMLYFWDEADYEVADVLTMENASGQIQLEGTGTEQYRGDIEGISAKNLSQAVYVAAVYSDGTTTWTSGVLGYSIGAYCSSQASKGGDVAELAMATAVYGYHAKLYFG